MHMTQPTKNHEFQLTWVYGPEAAYSGIHRCGTMEDNLYVGNLVVDLIVTQTDELLYWCLSEKCEPA